jgi:hypothetical protein
MKKIIASVLAGGLLFAVTGMASAGKPATMWEDAPGDANFNGVPGDQGGFDLVSGSVAKVGANLQFQVTTAAMPPNGALPEGFRFLWAFNVNSTTYRITAKSADIGKPDLLAGETTERVGTASPTGHFRLEGDCAAGETVGVLQPINCKPLAYVEGSFDAAAKTLTVLIPLSAIKAKTGSIIGPGSGDAITICQICWVTHAAERSLNNTIIDTASQTTTYKIPKK